jgi:hypothetical protein
MGIGPTDAFECCRSTCSLKRRYKSAPAFFGVWSSVSPKNRRSTSIRNLSYDTFLTFFQARRASKASERSEH